MEEFFKKLFNNKYFLWITWGVNVWVAVTGHPALAFGLWFLCFVLWGFFADKEK